MVWLFGPISGIVMGMYNAKHSHQCFAATLVASARCNYSHQCFAAGPLIGHYSDNCTHPLGRRRPVHATLNGAMLASVVC